MGSQHAFCLFVAFFLLLLPSSPSSAQLTHFSVTVPSDGESNDHFGYATAVSGGLMVVGSVWDDISSAVDQGSAYLFNCSSFPCAEIAKLTASDGVTFDRFGQAVAISGTTVAVGANFDKTDPILNHGSVYLFDCSSPPCKELTKLTAFDSANGEQFGYAVAISGELVASGALFANSGQGAVYLYHCPSSSCTLITKLGVPSATVFGAAIAMEGGRLVAGAYATSKGQGSAYLFDCTPSSCVQGATLTASDPADFSSFGGSVAISQDLVVVGANGLNLSRGAAYVFRCNSSSSCIQVDKLIAFDGADYDFFGWSVATSNGLVAVGAFGVSTSGPERHGAAYLYNCQKVPCAFLTKMVSADPQASAFLGYSVSMMGWKVAAGGYFDTVGEIVSGSVKWFDPSSEICNCSSAGSIGTTCGSDRQCSCKAGWTGLRCNIPLFN